VLLRYCRRGETAMEKVEKLFFLLFLVFSAIVILSMLPS
jgi:cell division protein FtsL